MKVKIKRFSNNGISKVCLLPQNIYSDLGLDNKKLYKLHLGQLSVDCLFKSHMKQNRCMHIPKVIFSELLLYENLDLNIWEKDGHIYLGPVVGMFVTTKYMTLMGKGKIPVTALEHIKEAAPYALSLCFCFSIYNIDWENKKISGYTYNTNLNKWQYQWFPMPDIIYDRAVGFKTEQKPLAKEIRDRFKNNLDIKFINNQGSLGKWPVYEKICQYSEVGNYLPETILYSSFDDVIYMLKKHRFIFVKSSIGSRGEEVLSIKLVDDKYRIDYYDDILKVKFVDDIEMVREHIEKFIEEKKALGRTKFIVQQGIRLLKYDGKNMDIRIHVVKDGKGEWQATNYYGIYARGNSTITNFCVGGDFNLYENLYSSLVEQHPNITMPTQDEIGEITIKIATFIEKKFGPMGEIGMDMAIDEEGKVWFIEGNARPDKYRTPGIDNMEGPSPQSLAIFKYSLYLAKNKK